jgi:hypothetical protein
VSFDGGDRWQPLRLNLPVCSVRDIEVHGSDLVIATHGRSFWILDDVEPLREMPASPPAERARLFRPEPAVRVHSAQFQGTPIPKDEPMGANRANGAILDYWIAPPGAASATLEIRDARGELMRRFKNGAPKAPDMAKLVFTADWEPPAPALSAAVGMHRFVWDLHTEPGAEISSEDEIESPGLWAPPGKYTARLVVDGEAFERPFDVVRDPRVTASDADLVAQFDLSRRVEEEQARLSAAIRDAGALAKRLAALEGSPDRLAERDAGSKRLLAILGKYEKYMTSGADFATMNGMSVVLSRLAGALESADAAPTPDDRRGVELHVAAAEKTISAWKAFEREERPRVEALAAGSPGK